MLRRLFSPAFLIPLGLALFVGGAKLGLIHSYASDQPFSDQWAAEGGAVFRWRLGGAWEFSHYFFPHGEHTPALTRVIATGCALANADQWDSRLEMLVSVGAHMLSAVLIWEFLGFLLSGGWRIAIAGAAALVLAMPATYENFLWGFQTQFIFLTLFGLAHLLGTLREERLGASWWLAQVAGLLVLFSIASGVLSAVVLIGAAVLRLWRAPRSPWAWATLGVNLLLVVLGAWLLHRAFFAAERTTGLSLAFFTAWGHLLAWPLPGPWLAGVTQAPILVFLWRERGRWTEWPVRMAVGLSVWTLALAAAFAYGRGTGAGEIAVRYMDPLSVGLVANLMVLGWLLVARGASSARWFAAVWLALLVSGLAYANRPAMLRGNLESQRHFFVRQQAAITAYMARNDNAELARDLEVRQFFPHYEQTCDVLADPLTRLSLPASLAAPLALQVDRGQSSPGVSFRVTRNIDNNARVLTLHGGATGARFVSQPVADDLRPVWRMRVSGRVGPGAGQIVLWDAAGIEHPPLDTAFDATGTWKTVNFIRGQGPVRLVVRVPPGGDLQVTEPLEMGWGSWLVPKVTGGWLALALAGGALFVAGVLRHRHSAPS